jgi:hypothetical protein
MGQPKVEEAGAVIVCCGDPDAPRGRNLDAGLTEAATEWLRFPQARIHMSQRFQPVERKDELDTVRLLWPKRAVIVEYGDVFDPLGAYYSFAAGMNPAGGKMHCQAVS